MADVVDKAGQIRAGEELDADKLGEHIRTVRPELGGTPRVTQFPGGASNLTYLLEFNGAELVLRRPPFGTKAKSAHDMKREYTVQSKLKPHFPYVPQMILFCADESIIGSEFYVMERVRGVIPRANMPKGIELDAAAAAAMCRSVVDRLIDLHSLDPDTVGLSDLGKGAGYVRRQIEGWSKRYADARTENVPDCARVMQWLQQNMPAEVGTRIIHNDYRMDNVILEPADLTRVIAVLDWEMATLGDPLMDLGNSLAYWVEADDPPMVQMLRRQPTNLPGMMTRKELVAYYLSKMGFGEVDFTFYRVYGLFRLAVILQQIFYRYHVGQTKHDTYKDYHYMVSFLDQYAQQILDGQAT